MKLGEPVFFASQTVFRDWLEQNHDSVPELRVGFHRKGTGPGMTYKEAVDEALCFGWIDGITHKLNETRFTVRFTPRRAKSTWSAVNIRRYGELLAMGRVASPGAAAFARRTEENSRIYSYERDPHALLAEVEAKLQADEAAWRFFSTQPPGYRRIAVEWVLDAKREESRARRQETLLADCAAGRRLKQFP